VFSVKIGKIDIPREIVSHIKITRKGQIQNELYSTFGTIEILASNMQYYDKFNEIFSLRKSYNDTIVRQVAIGIQVINHKFRFTSTIHRGEIGESPNEIHIKLERVDDD